MVDGVIAVEEGLVPALDDKGGDIHVGAGAESLGRVEVGCSPSQLLLVVDVFGREAIASQRFLAQVPGRWKEGQKKSELCKHTKVDIEATVRTFTRRCHKNRRFRV